MQNPPEFRLYFWLVNQTKGILIQEDLHKILEYLYHL